MGLVGGVEKSSSSSSSLLSSSCSPTRNSMAPSNREKSAGHIQGHNDLSLEIHSKFAFGKGFLSIFIVAPD